jgi:hypothetical protein
VKLSRRFQVKVDYWYCAEKGCPAGLTGHHNLSEAEATAHVSESGHEARVVKTRELILRPAEVAEVARG